MKTKSLNVYNQPVNAAVDNEYPTPHAAFRQPCLQMIVGQRTAGKSYLAAKILAEAKKDHTFDVVYMITPSWNSNRSYFKMFVKEENVFEPTRDSIDQVINMVEADRDEWERFVDEKRRYEQYLRHIRDGSAVIDDTLLMAYTLGWMDGRKPKWKYEKEEPVKSLLILDDVLSSPAISQSSGLTRIATLNRHIAPLKEDHARRSACGLAVIILTQTYRMTGGISRCLRENLSILTLFKNKQQKQMDVIREELANVVDERLFTAAYNYATKEKFGNLSVDFRPKCPTLTFRKNLSEAILFDELACTCHKKS